MSSNPVPNSGSAGRPVLIVDDDPMIRKLISHLLRGAGYDVVQAESGAEGIEAAVEHAPSLVLLDRDMPGEDGLNVCQALKDDPRLCRIPVMFLTGLSSPENKREGFQAGAVDYVTKPPDRMELLARVSTHVELARTHELVHRHNAELARTQELLRKHNIELEASVELQGGRLAQVREGQQSLLTDPAKFAEYRLGVCLDTANEAGGDFYDVVRLDESTIGLLVADVAGHDLASAYLTGALKALTVAATRTRTGSADVLRFLHENLRRLLGDMQYVTACFAIYDARQSTIEFSCAGHPEPLYIPNGGEGQYREAIGDVLGLLDDVDFETVRLDVAPGDRFFVFTDGVTEGYEVGDSIGARSVGEAQFQRFVQGNRHRSIQELVDLTIADIRTHQGLDQKPDDALLIGVEIK